MSKKVAIIGGSGFVGSAFVRSLSQFYDVFSITRNNYEERKGHYDIVIIAAGNSRKFFAESCPSEDFEQSACLVARYLHYYRAPYYVLVSTIDVYNDKQNPNNNHELQTLDMCNLSRYGMHRRLSEIYLESSSNNYLILRLGGMVGVGLWKNPIYDLLNKNKLVVHPESCYQYLNTDWVANCGRKLVGDCATGIFNVVGNGVVSVEQVADIIGVKILNDAYRYPTEYYEINNDKLALNFENIPKSIDVLKTFLEEYKTLNNYRESSCTPKVSGCLKKE